MISASAVVNAKTLLSDEVLISVSPIGDQLYLGVSLADVNTAGSNRCVIRAITPEATPTVRMALREGMILTAINGENVEGFKREAVAERIKINAGKQAVEIVFRDPNILFNKLNSSVSQDQVVTSLLLLASKVSAGKQFPAQVLRVERLELPPSLHCRVAAVGDVLEISYRLTPINQPDRLLQSSGPQGGILPASAPLSEFSEFFVLGGPKSPIADLRPEMLICLRGMSVGELRRIDFPGLLTPTLTPVVSSSEANRGEVQGVRLEARLLSINGVVG
jgi:hypothetical protein